MGRIQKRVLACNREQHVGGTRIHGHWELSRRRSHTHGRVEDAHRKKISLHTQDALRDPACWTQMDWQHAGEGSVAKERR